MLRFIFSFFGKPSIIKQSLHFFSSSSFLFSFLRMSSVQEEKLEESIFEDTKPSSTTPNLIILGYKKIWHLINAIDQEHDCMEVPDVDLDDNQELEHLDSDEVILNQSWVRFEFKNITGRNDYHNFTSWYHRGFTRRQLIESVVAYHQLIWSEIKKVNQSCANDNYYQDAILYGLRKTQIGWEVLYDWS